MRAQHHKVQPPHLRRNPDLNYMIVVMFLAQAGRVELTVGDIALGMALAILLNMGTITVPGGFPVVATLPRHVARPHA
ncbi:putative sodium/dicarboxylate symporter [Gordonia alkanivorans NBRC 16433]|nr:putative sodium/dicarboxylate symporter [Gordonia alkanivorans NBRC 16433]